MKKLICALFLSSLVLSACKNKKDNNEGDENPARKNVTKRDYSITAANAYNDLFMDSLTVENFIADQKVPDSLVRRIRSFYNSRNYQFAWFSSDGLTEQARGFWNLHSYYTKYSDDSTLDDNKLKTRMDNIITQEAFSLRQKTKASSIPRSFSPNISFNTP